MNRARRGLVGVLAWLAAAAAAGAASDNPLRKVEGQFAVERARALARKKLYERAQAILKTLPEKCPEVAEEAKKAAAEIAREAGAQKPPAVPEEYRKALERSRNTGRPMMLFFGREQCGLCKFTKSSLKSSKLASPRRRLIEVQLNCDAPANRPLMSKLADGKGMRMLPFIFYVSPTEELLDHSSGGQNVDALAAKLRDVLRAMGPPLSASRRARAAEALKRANAQMDAGNCGPALRTCRAIAELKAKSHLVEGAKANVEIIEGLARSLHDQARRAAGQSKFGDAIARLAILQRNFAGTEPAKAAAQDLEKLKDNPKAKAQLAAWLKQQPDTTGQPPTEPGEPKAKPKPAPSDARRAQSILRMARNYIANRRPDLAKPLLERVIEKHPDTDASREAAKLLKELE